MPKNPRSLAIVDHNTKKHKYGFQDAGYSQQTIPFRTDDFQYNPGNFCYEIVENSSFDPEFGKAQRQLTRNRFKPLGMKSHARADTKLPDFSAQRSQSTMCDSPQ